MVRALRSAASTRTIDDVLSEHPEHVRTLAAVPPANSGIVLPSGTGRPSNVTEWEGIVQVNKYLGLHQGRNGTHELFDGQIVTTNAVAKPKLMDTTNVQVAMNVSSSRDPAGLPREIPLQLGEKLELEGEFIPASVANLRNSTGSAAVLHFTHSPLGFAKIPVGGTEYT